MYAKVKSMGIFGFETFAVDVEADISSGLPRFDLVGLPDAAVKESRERVRSAIKNGGFHYPTARITVNIAPADIKKEGAVYDLPVFIALLGQTAVLKKMHWPILRFWVNFRWTVTCARYAACCRC